MYEDNTCWSVSSLRVLFSNSGGVLVWRFRYGLGDGVAAVLCLTGYFENARGFLAEVLGLTQ